MGECKLTRQDIDAIAAAATALRANDPGNVTATVLGALAQRVRELEAICQGVIDDLDAGGEVDLCPLCIAMGRTALRGGEG